MLLIHVSKKVSRNKGLDAVKSEHVWPRSTTNAVSILTLLNTLKARQNGRHFTDDIFKCIFLNKDAWILIKISLKFVHKGLSTSK